MIPMQGMVERRWAASSSHAICELGIEGGNPLIEAAPLSAQVLDQNPNARRQPGIVLIGEDAERILQLAPPLRHNDSALQQKSAQVVEQCRAFRYQTRTRSMQRLDVRLHVALDRLEAHRRPRRSLRDLLGIVFVVLVRLHIGPHIFRLHQTDRVAQGAEHPPKMMRAAACFHRHDARLHLPNEIRNAITTKATAQNNCATLVQPDEMPRT